MVWMTMEQFSCYMCDMVDPYYFASMFIKTIISAKSKYELFFDLIRVLPPNLTYEVTSFIGKGIMNEAGRKYGLAIIAIKWDILSLLKQEIASHDFNPSDIYNDGNGNYGSFLYLSTLYGSISCINYFKEMKPLPLAPGENLIEAALLSESDEIIELIKSMEIYNFS